MKKHNYSVYDVDIPQGDSKPLNCEDEAQWRELLRTDFNFDDFLNDNPNFDYDMIVVYELTESESDEELKQYDEWLLDGLQNTIRYIHQLEKKIRKLQKEN